MLGTLALGNLLQMPLTAGLQPAGNTIRFICGLLAAVMLVLLLLKLIMYPKMFAEDMKNPIMAGVAATFPMALMLFSVYWKPVIKGASKVIWWIAIILQIVLIIYFTAKFIVKLDLKKVFAAYFIIYAGGTVSAPVNNEVRDEAVSALTMLGFAPAPTQKVVMVILQDQPDLPVEQVVKLALKQIK